MNFLKSQPPTGHILLGLISGLALLGVDVNPASRVGAGCIFLLASIGRGSRRFLWLGLFLAAIGAGRSHLQMRALDQWWEAVPPLARLEGGRLCAPGLPRVSLASQPLASPLPAGIEAWKIGRRPHRRNPDDSSPLQRAVASGGQLRAWPLTKIKEPQGFTTSALEGSSGMWRALFLGDRRGLSTEARSRFTRLGLAHLLALSGLHVGLMLGLTWPIVRSRSPRAPLWLLLPLFLWLAVVGASPSFLRAVAMAVWLILARAMGRPASPAWSLLLVATLEGVFRPWVLLQLGWQLSYAATAAILGVVGELRGKRAGHQALVVGIVAQAATLPWMLSTFGQWPWAGLVLQLALGPLFAVVLAAGGILLAIGTLLPVLADSSEALVQLLSHIFGGSLLLADKVSPGPLGHTPIRGVAWMLLLLASLPVWWPRPGWSWSRRLLPLIGLFICIHGAMILDSGAGDEGARWWSLDVGQGDAGVYRSADGAWMVVDAGDAHDAPSSFDAGARVVLPFLARRNAQKLTLVLSHGHRDHTGGAASLLHSGRVERMAVARADSGESWVEELRREAVGPLSLLYLEAGEAFRVGESQIEVLWPPPTAGDFHRNDRSLVLRLGPVGEKLLLAGDLERAGESGLLASGRVIEARYLKVAHHGGDTGSDPPFLRKVDPEWAVLSCGWENRHGHPHPALLRRLWQLDLRVHRTDREGAFGLHWRADGVVEILHPGLP